MNIELHGFPQTHIKSIILEIWSKLNTSLTHNEALECVVTVVPSSIVDFQGKNEPFIRVYSNKKLDFEFVAKHLKPLKTLGTENQIFVECVLLYECFEL
ncbi:MAG: hypothetical protein WCJ74_02720 [bacterium]